ncbi:phospholipase D-like domain-containing protein [Tichowtungia aerotolerans]|uniref:Phospholipase n=1 Tax=Tichowtungia aerotolerans TaxID=2697043 RepID=A0A6P1MA99_9BACT|nr:phospholipase D-like domain-containing protein [Tichowtungia aerotolerans]QHI69018.1 phospholipase [Tichowtungia aerotolerans]
METAYIANEAHYDAVLCKALDARRTLWIGTADLKDLHVKTGGSSVPFLQALAERIEGGLEVRLIHAKEPGPRFREDFDRFPALATHLERIFCPRVHFKLIIIDCKTAYIGSANLTGAGLGMKSPRRRNFEAGVLTDDPALVEQAVQQFDDLWIGTPCQTCGRTEYCTDRIEGD